jgi:hypothetical protein
LQVRREDDKNKTPYRLQAKNKKSPVSRKDEKIKTPYRLPGKK